MTIGPRFIKSCYRKIAAKIRQSVGDVPQPLTVLHSLREPSGPTTYASQMKESAPSSLSVRFFNWRTALFGSYDVFHVHWPEYLFRGHNVAFSLLRKVLFLALLLRLSVTNKPLIRTLHNIEPHDGASGLDRMLLALCDRCTTLFIRLNPLTPAPENAVVRTILHGHYVDRFAAHPKADPQAGRILYFGLIRPYKGVPKLIDVFGELNERDDLVLKVVGKPSDAQLEEEIRSVAALDSRVKIDLRFVDDHDLVHEISSAALVVLPYSEMHNSGAILVALSLNRPVLAPSTPANRALSEEVGPGWIYLYEGVIAADVLAAALETSKRGMRSSSPQLSGRAWDVVGISHYCAYSDARRPAPKDRG